MKPLALLVLSILVVVPFVEAKSPPPGTGKADVPANILFMLDTSGSMGARVAGQSQLHYPIDVVIDSHGNKFVIEHKYHRIKKYSPSGRQLKIIGGYGSGNGRFSYPYKIAIDSNDNIYVAAIYNTSIQKFNNEGVWQKNFGGAYRPYSVAVDANGNVYAGSAPNNGITKWASNGARVKTWGIHCPLGISAHGGSVYVVNGCVHPGVVTQSSEDGVWQNDWRTLQGGYPFDVEVTSNGVYVANSGNHHIEKYSHSGTYIKRWGGYGNGDSQFAYIHGVGSDQSGNIYGTDFYNGVVKEFDPNGVHVSTSPDTAATRLSQMKKVIKRIVTNSDLTSGANFGLMEWNHYARMLVNISSSGATQIYTKVDSLRAYGGTNLDPAMQLAQNYMYGSNSPIDKNASCQKNILIVLSDGVWHDNRASKIAAALNEKGCKTFVIGFHTTGNSNYLKLSKAGGTYPESPLYSDNWQHLYETLSNYIRQAISSRLTFSVPALMPSIGAGNHLYQSTFTYSKDHQWQGHLTKYKLNPNGDIGKSVWDAGEKLNAKSATSRRIWTMAKPAGIATELNNFTATNLEGLKALLWEDSGTNPTDAEATKLINFVRGLDAYDENANSNTTEARWKLGDIYHSELRVVGPPSASTTSDNNFSHTQAFYRHQKNYRGFANGNRCGGSCASRKEVVYAGANDGMLHAFDALSGDELWGFIPPTMLPHLRSMVSVKANSTHSIYGVDGSPVVEDVYYGNRWRTVLLAGMGRGGHGYFALDVTDPVKPAFLFAFVNKPTDQYVRHWDADGNLTELHYGGLTAAFDYSKLGEAWSTPTILHVPAGKNGKWVAVFGAGFNSGVNKNYGSSIYAIDLEDQGKVLKRIDLTDAPNDIANSVPTSLTAVTPDSTSLATYKGALVYFADLEGKLWKLNLTDQDRMYEATQIFNAEATQANDRFAYQQVTPSIDNEGTLWIYYGTGSYQQLQRMSPSIKNRLFGVKDKNFPTFKAVNASTINQMKDTTATGNVCPGNSDLGWYYDFDANEKISGKVAVYNETIFASRYTPNRSNICNPGQAKLSEHSYSCGNMIADVDLGVGVPTGVTVFGGRIYMGISGEGQKTGSSPSGYSQTDNIIVGRPSKASSGKGSVSLESWREIF